MRLFYKAPAQKRPVAGARPMSMFAMMCSAVVRDKLPDVASAARACDADVIATSKDARRVLIEATAEQKATIEKDANVVLHVNNDYHVAAMHSRLLASVTNNVEEVAGPHPYRYLVATQEGTPVSNASVFVCLNEDLTAKGTTDEHGIAEFSLNVPKTLNVFAYPRENFWCGGIDNSDTTSDARKIIVEPLSLGYPDALAHFRSKSPKPSKLGEGINVAIIDTGVDQHEDFLPLSIKKTILNGEVVEGDCSDNWLGHGTHVAGIIAGCKHGIAPKAQLMGYAVFPKDQTAKTIAESLDISTAIDFAVDEGAHIINLSLGWTFRGEIDVPVAESIERAVNSGVIVIAATGNDSAEQVTFPANHELVCAVGAVAAKDKFSVSSTHRYVGSRVANSLGDFVPMFSNFETNKVQAAAPGLAVVSTTLTKGYVSMSGTSMAAPVVSGVAARLLSDNPELLKLTGQSRVSQLLELLYNGCDDLELDSTYVGAGVPTY